MSLYQQAPAIDSALNARHWSQEAGSRIVNECKPLNPDGKFTFIAKDTSLIRNVDEICKTIEQNEKSINLLFLTIGTLQTGKSECSRGMNASRRTLICAQQRMKVSITLRHLLSMHAIGSSQI